MDYYSEIIIEAVDKNKNAVVKIDVLKKQKANYVYAGSGSGFAFSSDGLIFTNNHVIQHGDKITVTLLDGTQHNAEIVGRDPDTDLAIIKVFGSGYSVAKLGKSENLQIGQLLIAIGNPLGYQHSVSSGVLSGLGRTIRSTTGRMIENVLQSDAALNPGNSGGPMINTAGEVIGVNTAILQGAQGVSFSIDIDTAKEVAKHLIKDGKVIRAYLGIAMQEMFIHKRIKNYHNLKSDKGLRVVGIEEKSPAERSNLKEGDIIIEFDNQTVKSSSGLFKQLTSDKIFNPTKIKIIRSSAIMELDIFPVEKK